jgi:hypothetical protein
MLRHLWSAFLRSFGWIWRRRIIYYGQHVADLPDNLAHGVVYIVGDHGYDWSAAMLCPGGCGKTLEMNLLPDATPVWTLNEHADQSLSLRPSVWLKSGCGCHFILTEGHVQWT